MIEKFPCQRSEDPRHFLAPRGGAYGGADKGKTMEKGQQQAVRPSKQHRRNVEDVFRQSLSGCRNCSKGCLVFVIVPLVMYALIASLYPCGAWEA